MPGFASPGTAQSVAYDIQNNMNSMTYPIATSAKLYGAVPAEQDHPGAPTRDGLLHLSLHPEGGRRARIDFQQVFLTMLAPVAVFAVTAALLSFKLNYNLWILAWFLALCCAAPGGYAWSLGLKVHDDGERIQGKWMLLLGAFCTGAWLLALVVGEMNYSTNLKPFYDMEGLNYYPSVDPAASGESHIDAGRMLFQPKSWLDVSRAMGVRIGTTYCVAPVRAASNSTASAGGVHEWDYWAVGINCCSSVQPQSDWRCGDVNNQLANGGMRLMSDDARPFFRMAVQEAEATYKIRAKHPIFIHWLQDPSGEMALWHETGVRIYWEGVLSFVVLMLFLSLAAGLYFSRASMESHPCKGTGFLKYRHDNPEHDFLAEEGYEEASNFKSVTL